MRFELPLLSEKPRPFPCGFGRGFFLLFAFCFLLFAFYFFFFFFVTNTAVADAPQSSEESLSGPNSSLTTFSMYSCIVMITRRGLLPSGGLI